MRRAMVLMLAVLLSVVAGPARADLLQDLGATFERVAQELGTTFPKVEARIAAVSDTEVRLEGPGVSALRPGLELVAYRRGELFRHPVTGQPLGHAEEEVGILTVTAVAEDHATARVVATESGRMAVVGDGARITAGRIPVAVLPPLGVSVPGESEQTALLLVARLSALLEKTGRFLAVDPRRVLEVTQVQGGSPAGAGAAPTPLEVARRLAGSAVLTSRVVQEGRTRAIEWAWISGRTGATLVAGRTSLARALFPPRFAWEQTPELERRYQLEGPVRGLAVADVDGDGRADVVVAVDRGITMFRWQTGIGLIPMAGGEYRPGGLVLSLDAADVNGAGRAQVVVVEQGGVGQRVRSRVLQRVGERFQTLYEVEGRYLRVIHVGTEPWLLEQAVGLTEPFDRTIRRLVWQGGRYRDGTTLQVPAGVSVYGLALMRLTGSPEPEVVALTPEDRLVVWTARGQRLWASADAYGGAPISFPFTPAHDARGQDAVIGRILGRVIPLADAPEGPEILVFQNLLPLGDQGRTLLPGLVSGLFTQGRIHRLRWQEGGFLRVWQSRLTEGYISDFAHGDVDGDGVPEVLVGVVPRGLNLDTFAPGGRPKAHLVLYELP